MSLQLADNKKISHNEEGFYSISCNSSFFLRMCKFMNKNDASKILISSSKLYKDLLANNNFLIIYGNNNKLKHIETLFLQRNFMHLTGCCSCKGQAKMFYKKCINGKIVPQDITYKKDGTSRLKLNILEQMMHIENFSKIFGTFDCQKPHLQTEKLIGSKTVCMGFVKDGNYYVPNTILKENVSVLTSNPERIHAIMRKNKNEQLYNKIIMINPKSHHSSVLDYCINNNLISDNINLYSYASSDIIKNLKASVN